MDPILSWFHKVYFNTDYIFDDKEIVKFFTCDNGIMVRCFKIESLSVKEKNIQWNNMMFGVCFKIIGRNEYRWHKIRHRLSVLETDGGLSKLHKKFFKN